MNHSYNKLVRDKIPQLIEESGRSYTSRILDEQEYFDALIDKIIEEIEDYKVSGLEEEIADVYEALDCLIELKGYEPMHIDYLQLIRKEARGSFKDKLLLIDVEDSTV